MCGINGILSFKGNEISPRLIQEMNLKLIHRGPDDEGVWTDVKIAIGMRRLSIIDLEGGHQPIISKSGRYVIVLNGEIYNYIELRKSLETEGFVFSTNSDTEVLLTLFEKEGLKCIDKVNGMFAFAIWDKLEKNLHIFRDRVGIKPLFYFIDKEHFVFSSSLSCFSVLPFIDIMVNREIFFKHIIYGYVPNPNTIIKGINKLEPGHYLKIGQNGKLHKQKYWEALLTDDVKLSVYEYEEEIIRILRDSLRMQTRSDVPIGTFLSGGMDSSAVVSFLSEITSPIRTFSLGFANGLNELPLAKLVADRFDTEHTEYILREKDILQVLQELIPFLDEPLADNSIIPTYFLSKQAKENGIKVILNGTGGDEIFGGYNRYLTRFKYEKYFNLFPDTIVKLFGKSFYPFSKNRSFILTEPRTTYFSRISGINLSFIYELLKNKSDLKNIMMADGIGEGIIRYPIIDNRNLMKIDLASYLVDNVLSLTDKMSMANSVEIRVPLLDHRLIEFAYSIPQNTLFTNGQLKGLFKKLLKEYIPAELYALKKSGFSGPTGTWVNGVLKENIENELIDKPIDFFSEIFNLNKLKTFFTKEGIIPHNYSETIFSLYVFTIWYKHHYSKS